MANQTPVVDNQKNDCSINTSDEDYDKDLMNTWQGNEYGHGVPEFGYKLALSHTFKHRPTSWSYPPLSQVPSLIGLSIRYLLYYRQLAARNKKPCMDFFNQNALHQIYGVPLGGIGGGTINRGWKGDFCKWQLQPGIYSFNSPLADQFIVTVRRNKRTVYQQVLNTRCPSGSSLHSWNWNYCGNYAFYHGLYPRAWTVYDLQGQGIVLTCRQISPVFPHEYKDTSIPAAVFVWHVKNNRSDEAEVAITLTMENGIGCPRQQKSTSGAWNESFVKDESIVGVTMHNSAYPTMPYTMTVATSRKEGVMATQCASFDPMSDGRQVWSPLLEDGKLRDNSDTKEPTKKGQVTACAVSALCHVQGNSSNESIEFALAWDMPKINFGDNQKQYRRRYTRWFGSDGKAGPLLAQHALRNYKDWEDKIDQWQNPVLRNTELPSWYKSAIFNELYYVSDGGTIWLEVDEVAAVQNGFKSSSNNNHAANGSSESVDQQSFHISEADIHNLDFFKEYGKFAYLEGQEYKMYNTYDVHFYASIALADLWPMLELSVQYDIAASILHSNTTKKKYLMDGDIGPVKTPNVVPHDIGCPGDDPWISVNAYFVHDTADWRDLNPKFVLQVYRDFHLTQNRSFLETIWPVCKIVMRESMKHDKDGDGLIENSGGADQTFDGWCVTGPSAYCGGLWIAALRCMIAAAEELELPVDAENYRSTLKRAVASYQNHLWNGKYFNYDCGRHSEHRTSVMADQCAGQWILSVCGIDDVLPREQVASALSTVFKLNVCAYDGGRHGAVNGMRPNGRVDESSVQSNEVWTGVTYALAATMIHKGMLKEGFQTASGIYQTCWQRNGMAYQTPEAFKKNGTYRSLAYMRPLSIWGMQYALENAAKEDSNPVADQQ